MSFQQVRTTEAMEKLKRMNAEPVEVKKEETKQSSKETKQKNSLTIPCPVVTDRKRDQRVNLLVPEKVYEKAKEKAKKQGFKSFNDFMNQFLKEYVSDN